MMWKKKVSQRKIIANSTDARNCAIAAINAAEQKFGAKLLNFSDHKWEHDIVPFMDQWIAQNYVYDIDEDEHGVNDLIGALLADDEFKFD